MIAKSHKMLNPQGELDKAGLEYSTSNLALPNAYR